MTKLTRSKFIELARKGSLEIGLRLNYVVVKVNSENINMTISLKDQLIKEGKYDETYIGILTPETSKPYSMDYLPVYGDVNRFVTKHFLSSVDEAITANLKDREMKLLKRYNEYNQ